MLRFSNFVALTSCDHGGSAWVTDALSNVSVLSKTPDEIPSPLFNVTQKYFRQSESTRGFLIKTNLGKSHKNLRKHGKQDSSCSCSLCSTTVFEIGFARSLFLNQLAVVLLRFLVVRNELLKNLPTAIYRQHGMVPIQGAQDKVNLRV